MSAAERKPARKKRTVKKPRNRAAPDKFRYTAEYRTPAGRKVTRAFTAPTDAAAKVKAARIPVPAGAELAALYNDGSADPRSRARPNPSTRNLDAELERARRAFERFTGHSADFVEEYMLPDAGGAAWALGPVAAISYIATRDGETFEYQHRFRERSQPLLAVSLDGQSLFLLGGAYNVTDRGIVDA